MSRSLTIAAAIAKASLVVANGPASARQMPREGHDNLKTAGFVSGPAQRSGLDLTIPSGRNSAATSNTICIIFGVPTPGL